MWTTSLFKRIFLIKNELLYMNGLLSKIGSVHIVQTQIARLKKISGSTKFQLRTALQMSIVFISKQHNKVVTEVVLFLIFTFGGSNMYSKFLGQPTSCCHSYYFRALSIQKLVYISLLQYKIDYFQFMVKTQRVMSNE